MGKYILVKTLIVVGCILIIAGILFVAQSKSEVGPQSSFMYRNPQWTVNGFAICIIGLVALVCGITIRYIKHIQ
jgi:hypothetical protein